MQKRREEFARARRVVVKVGSRVLVQKTGRPDARRIRALVKGLAALHRRGCDVAFVTSGAIGTGMEALGLKERPTTLPELQMCAAVGQTRLMSRYEDLFAAEGIKIGQILLTRDDLKNRTRHLNARNTMMSLFRHRIIPVVNENDVVAVDEIKLGDNDVLASLAAILVDADALVLLTTTDGLREPVGGGKTRRVSMLEELSADTMSFVSGKGSSLSTGGMATKLQAAANAARVGIPSVIADGRKPHALAHIFEGRDTGTLMAAAGRGTDAYLSRRKRWIAFFHRTDGAVVVDDGASTALINKGRSLLPIGVKEVEGTFPAGVAVNIRRLDGELIARGLTEYSSAEILKIKGRKTSEIKAILGSRDYDEIVHRDNMVLLKTPKQGEKS
ncbi:MAG: glutamate 5-kinase [Kiritimatiellia bacterium]